MLANKKQINNDYTEFGKGLKVQIDFTPYKKLGALPVVRLSTEIRLRK